MILLLLTWLGVAEASCPDYIQAIEDAEDALKRKDYDRLEESLEQAQRGLSCGPILENRALRSSFFLSLAVLLDAYGDSATSEMALVAAWRADPNVSIRRLPNHLRVRYSKVIERPFDDVKFRLHPAPDPNAVIYVDGRPFQQRAVDDSLAHDASIQAKAGLHIIQLAETPIALTATASRVSDLSNGEFFEFDIYEEALLGRPLTPLQIGADFGRASGGCSGRR